MEEEELDEEEESEDEDEEGIEAITYIWYQIQKHQKGYFEILKSNFWKLNWKHDALETNLKMIKWHLDC